MPENISISLITMEIQTKTAMRYNFIFVRTAITKKQELTRVARMQKKETLTLLVECKLVQSHGKQFGHY